MDPKIHQKELVEVRVVQAAVLAVLLFLGGVTVCLGSPQTFNSPEGTVREGCNMISTPAIPYDNAPAEVFGEIPIDGCLSRWDLRSQSDIAYDEWDPTAFGGVILADGYHLSSTEAGTITFDGYPTDEMRSMWIGLHKTGAAKIGVPYTSEVPWENVRVTDGRDALAPADATDWIASTAAGWDNVNQTPTAIGSNDNLEPWQSYWIDSVSNNTDEIALIIPNPLFDPPSHSGGGAIWSVKDEADGTSVSITGNMVTYVATDFFYVEQDNLTCGIRVHKDAHGLSLGMRASVSGTIETNDDGERYIEASTVTTNGVDEIEAHGINNRALGGGNWCYDDQTGAGQKGVIDGYGLNNIGLLVTTWGKFSYGETLWDFMIDDGSRANVKCVTAPGEMVGLANGWDYVRVTGVVSCYKDGDDLYPQILIRSSSDLEVLHSVPPPSFSAAIDIDASTVTSSVSQDLFSSNIHWKDLQCMLNDPPSEGFREDFIELATEAHIPIMRHNTGDWCRWRRGVGPADERPLADMNGYYYLTPYVGTDEYVSFCNSIGVRDIIFLVNALQCGSQGSGSHQGSVQEAANWVEYCNGDSPGLAYGDDQHWVPSIFVHPDDVGEESQPEEYLEADAVEWAGAWYDEFEDYHHSFKSTEQAPAGYFAWLREYFAYQRGESDPGPYGVTYWEIGNEVYWQDQWSTIDTELTGNEYAQMVADYSEAMKAKDSSIKIGAVVIGQEWYFVEGWDECVITGCADSIDFVYPHIYSAVDGLAFDLLYAGPPEGSYPNDQRLHCRRTVGFPTTDVYTIKVTARARLVNDAQGVDLSGLGEEELDEYLGAVDVAADLDLRIDGVTKETFHVDRQPDVYEWTGEVTAGNREISLAFTNDINFPNADPPQGRDVLIYKVTRSSESIEEESIWYPEYAEQMLIANDDVPIHNRIQRLRNLIGSNEIEILVTEGNLGYRIEGSHDSAGFDPDEPRHPLRYKGVFWLFTAMKQFMADQIPAYCHWNLASPGYWGLIRRPDYTADPEHLIVTPSYHMLKLFADYFPDTDVVYTSVDSPGYGEWPEGIPLPAWDNIREATDCPDGGQCYTPHDSSYLDAISCKSDDGNTLFIMVANRSSSAAETTIGLSGFVPQSTGTTRVLHIRSLANQECRLISNPDPEMEACSETLTGDTKSSWVPDDIRVTVIPISGASTSFEYRFIPYSITLLQLSRTQ